MVGGSSLWCTAITALNSPAAPAAALVWPICDFTDPSAHHCTGCTGFADSPEWRPAGSQEGPGGPPGCAAFLGGCSGASPEPLQENASPSPSNSAASPALVPVPWASINSMVRADTPACSRARRSATACPAETGAYTLLLRPSDDDPIPRITA